MRVMASCFSIYNDSFQEMALLEKSNSELSIHDSVVRILAAGYSDVLYGEQTMQVAYI